MAIKIGIVGYGNMGAAIAERLAGLYQIHIYDKDPLKTSNCPKGITVAQDARALCTAVSTVILAVKPQDFEAILTQIGPYLSTHLVVSIAAGISTEFIESRIEQAHVIRVMPNLPATVGAGMSCLCKGRFALNIDLSFVQSLFNRLGKTLVLDERHMNAVTAISGSGPGFFFDLIRAKPKDEWAQFAAKEFIPKLSQAAQATGLSITQANLLAETTAAGSLELLSKTGKSPDILCIRVTSRGGTTEAGLRVLLSSIDNLEGAVKAALQRAEELARK